MEKRQKSKKFLKKVGKKQEESKITQKLPKINFDQAQFMYSLPPIRFGKGVINKLPQAIFELMQPISPFFYKKVEIIKPKLLMVIGKESLKQFNKYNRIFSSCEENNIQVIEFSCGSGEADVNTVNRGVKLAREEKIDFITGIGGGSVLDTAKAISMITTNGGKAQDYHDGKKFIKPSIPCIVIPTTAGTGSEISRKVILIDNKRGFKKEISGKNLIPNYILLDPELGLTVPPDITAYCGIIALIQAIQAFVLNHNHPLVDLYARRAISMIGKNLKIVVNDGKNYKARAEMLLGSLYSGIAFSEVNLRLDYGLADIIGYKYNIPFGKICGYLFPLTIEYHIDEYADRFAQVAKIISNLELFSIYESKNTDKVNAIRLISMIKELLNDINISFRLQDLGITQKNLDQIIEKIERRLLDTNSRTSDINSIKKYLEKAFYLSLH